MTSFVVPVVGSTVAGCRSDADDVCEKIGTCARADGDWIEACQREAKVLANESGAGGCAALFRAYYACASQEFVCEDGAASFPACVGARAALDRCLSASAATNACGELAEANLTCGVGAETVDPDAARSESARDAGDAARNDLDAATGPLCSVARACAARCFLDAVANACAPSLAEIASVTSCSASCPP